jgi:hypothetical protein
VAEHPYRALPDKAFWRRSVAVPDYSEVDPVGEFRLRIRPQTRVATAGSCFAQHIARHLKKSGFNYYVAETGHPILPQAVRDNHNYGVFSARYGNLYTARQLVQLIKRAYGKFSPSEGAWVEGDGRVLDPFRPTVQPGGYVSVDEMLWDRKQHLACVRRMFETLDVFVFTLGLTECWLSRADGAAFPLCPGVEGGTFDAGSYAFRNQDVNEVYGDLDEFLAILGGINERAQVILTVSPVPLMATAQPGAHVLSATTYSKSVLRVAADMICRRHDRVHYFPSFEIITGQYARGRYFAQDLRGVTEEGVSHVMRLFLKHVTEGQVFERVASAPSSEALAGSATQDQTVAEAERLIEVECDEVALDRPE